MRIYYLGTILAVRDTGSSIKGGQVVFFDAIILLVQQMLTLPSAMYKVISKLFVSVQLYEDDSHSTTVYMYGNYDDYIVAKCSANGSNI